MNGRNPATVGRFAYPVIIPISICVVFHNFIGTNSYQLVYDFFIFLHSIQRWLPVMTRQVMDVKTPNFDGRTELVKSGERN